MAHGYQRYIQITHLPEENGRQLADDISKCSFMNGMQFFQILLGFVPKESIDYKSVLVQVMASRELKIELKQTLIQRWPYTLFINIYQHIDKHTLYYIELTDQII